jgi:hypothetical protein
MFPGAFFLVRKNPAIPPGFLKRTKMAVFRQAKF